MTNDGNFEYSRLYWYMIQPCQFDVIAPNTASTTLNDMEDELLVGPSSSAAIPAALRVKALRTLLYFRMTSLIWQMTHIKLKWLCVSLTAAVSKVLRIISWESAAIQIKYSTIQS